MTITQEQQKILDEAKAIAKANPDLDLWNGKEEEKDYEKRFLDTQASYTKANQEKIDLAKLLVEQNPKNVEKISDVKLQNKILQDKWQVDNIEELKTLFPDYAKSEDDDEDDLSEIETIKRELKLMKYKNKKESTREALVSIALQNKEVVWSISDFEQKMRDELKFISESVEPNERMKKAFQLVVGSDWNSADAYSIMQWVTIKKTPWSEADQNAVLKEQNELRKLLGLKTK